MQNKVNGDKVIGILLIVIACIVWAAGIFSAVISFMVDVGRSSSAREAASRITMKEFMKNSVETSGTVEDVYISSKYGYTTIGFDNGTGHVTVELDTYSGDYPEGTSITVYYGEEYPMLCAVPALSDEVHAIDSNIYYNMGGIVGAGVVVFPFGLVLLIFGIKLTAGSKKKVLYN